MSTLELDDCGDPTTEVNDNVTVMGLNKWYSCKIEKLGWMVIEAKNNDGSSLKRYKCGLQHLLKHVKAKQTKQTTDQDKQNDLTIMEKNILIIHKLVLNMLKTPEMPETQSMLSGGKRGSKKSSKKSSKKGSKKGSKKSKKM